MTKNRFFFIILITISILLIPLIAMQFTDQVNWALSDFLIAGLLLSFGGFLIDFILRRINNTQDRMIYILAFIIMFLLVWAELAVGVFGSPLAGN